MNKNDYVYVVGVVGVILTIVLVLAKWETIAGIVFGLSVLVIFVLATESYLSRIPIIPDPKPQYKAPVKTSIKIPGTDEIYVFGSEESAEAFKRKAGIS